MAEPLPVVGLHSCFGPAQTFLSESPIRLAIPKLIPELRVTDLPSGNMDICRNRVVFKSAGFGRKFKRHDEILYTVLILSLHGWTRIRFKRVFAESR